MKIYNLFIAIAIICVGSIAWSEAQAKGMATEDFVRKAAIANQFEIESSQLALDKAQDAKVKQFAQRMIDEHTKTGKDMETALQSESKDIALPDKLDTKHQKMLDKLQSASDARFDSQYLSAQKDAHKEAVKLFSNYSKKGQDPALKEFAAQTLPGLKDHQTHVKNLKVTD